MYVRKLSTPLVRGHGQDIFGQKKERKKDILPRSHRLNIDMLHLQLFPSVGFVINSVILDQSHKPAYGMHGCS